MQTKRGFTLIETVFYTAGLLLLVAAMVTFMIYMYNWYNNVTIIPRADRAGVNMVDKIVKDLRSGEAVNLAGSSFESVTGALSIDAVVGGATVTKYFSLDNGKITYKENSGTTQNISPGGMTVSRFYINSTSTPISEAIRFDIDISFNTKTGLQTKTYTGLAVLRQSY